MYGDCRLMLRRRCLTTRRPQDSCPWLIALAAEAGCWLLLMPLLWMSPGPLASLAAGLLYGGRRLPLTMRSFLGTLCRSGLLPGRRRLGRQVLSVNVRWSACCLLISHSCRLLYWHSRLP